MATEMIMPEMGEGVIEGTVSRWLKKIGDAVEQYEPIVEIETDKVTTEGMAETAGVLLAIHIKEGATVDVGTVLATIGEAGEEVTVTEVVDSVPAPVAAAPTVSAPAAPIAPPTSRYTGRISPVVGRMAAEHEINLDYVTGTGKNGRVTKKDVQAYIKSGATATAIAPTPPAPLPARAPAPPSPSSPPAPPAPIAAQGDELVPLTNMRRAIAEHMVRSKKTSPHVTTVFEFDFTAVSAHRAANKAQFARDGAKLTYTAYLVAATVQALKKHPMVNSVWSDDGVIMKRDVNLGMATAIDAGLIVPVIRNADSMNLLGLARTINDLADRARRNKLQPNEVSGGTFTLTNHGVSGSLFATPIINQPQCGILGAGIIEKRVKVINDAIAIRPMAYISFTFDHRILDGATADYFVAEIKQIIENWA